MRRMSFRSARDLSAALLMVLAGTVAAAASSGDTTARLGAVERLMEQGKVVAARAELLALKRAAQGDEQVRVVELLASADRRMRALGEVELSLQKAELAIENGELRLADTHASAARRSDKAGDEQRERASALLDRSNAVRSELAPMIAPALAQAVLDYNDQRYAEAKAGFSSVVRTGAPLSQEQMALVNRYQDRIYDLERQAGKIFESEYVPLGVLRSAAARGGEVEAAAAALGAAAQPDEPAPQPQEEAPQPQKDEAQPGARADQAQPGDDLLSDAQFDAERVYNEAQVAFGAGRYNEAAEKFLACTTTYARLLSAEQLATSRDRLAEAEALLGGDRAGALAQVGDARKIMREEALATYDNLVQQAAAARDRGDIQAARNQAAQARLGWSNAYANGLFPEAQFRQRAMQVDELIRGIDAAAEALTIREIGDREAKLKTEEAKARAQQESERQARINENLMRLRSLQAEQKYNEALQVAEQVLFLDPINPAALLIKDILKDLILYREFDASRRARGLSYTKDSNDAERGLIIPDSVMNYPADWPELSFRRGEIQSFVESDADRRVLATLDSRRIPASFADNSLADVLSFIATVTNVNMDTDWDSLEQLGVTRDKPVTLELREVPARVVLNRVLEKAQPDQFSKLGWAVNDGVLVIAADEALRRNTFVVIYDIRDLLFQIPNFLDAPRLDLDQVLNQGQQGSSGSTGGIFEGGDEENPGEGPTEEELMRQILDIIQTNVDFEGWRDNGGSTGVVQELNGNLIITNTGRNHREIQGLLNQLREIRSVQINVESRFLTVRQDFFEQIGFDVDVFFNASGNQFKAVQRQLQAFGQGSLANEGLSILPSDIVTGRNGSNQGFTVTGTDPVTGGPIFTFQPNNFSIPAPNNTSVIPAQQNSLGITNSLIEAGGTAFSSAVLMAGNPALAVAGTFLDDVQVDFLLEATQADQRSVALSAPRLTFSNGRSANISVTNQVGFVSDLTPVVGTSSVAFDPTIGRINSGFTLAVRGVASADRRYVTLTVVAAVSGTPSFTQQIINATVAGTGGTGGTGLASAIIQIPTIDVTQVNTGVTIPDRGTVLLGGQRLTNELEIETGVPVLSKLPLINRFFTNRSEVREERTLMILMKPTILIQNEEEEKNFPGLLDKLRDPFR